ncbi:MAG: hypothetical protein NWE93_00140 [Candidatus Bathyarchaeota archaeon]|nr:hypothetical protein [Candidatus Bathyarchaeota archaeon]
MLIDDAIGSDINLLTKLGLTTLQAQVYFMLTQTEEATIKTISNVLKIDRANLYRIMPQLQKLNLVEKTLSNPTLFNALPLEDGISMLLEQRAKEYREIKEETNELLLRNKREHRESTANDECQFAFVPDGKLSMRRIGEIENSTQKTFDLICYWTCCEFEKNDKIHPGFIKLMKKGVQLRQLAYIKDNDEIPKKPLRIQKYANFNLRFTRTPPKTTISISDSKQALLTVFPYLLKSGTPSLFVSNSGIVSILQDYFELMWHDTAAFDFP